MVFSIAVCVTKRIVSAMKGTSYWFWNNKMNFEMRLLCSHHFLHLQSDAFEWQLLSDEKLKFNKHCNAPPFFNPFFSLPKRSLRNAKRNRKCVDTYYFAVANIREWSRFWMTFGRKLCTNLSLHSLLPLSLSLSLSHSSSRPLDKAKNPVSE